MKAWLLKLFGPIGEFLGALFSNAINKELKIVLPIAAKFVAQVAKDPSLLSGGAKFDAAAAGIMAELASAQINVAVSTLNLAIELAYTKYSVEQAAATPVVASN